MLLALAVAGLAEGVVERRIRQRVERAAIRLGVKPELREVRFSWLRPLTVEGLRLERPGQGYLAIERLSADWSAGGGLDARHHLRELRIEALVAEAAGFRLAVPSTTWALDWRAGPDGDLVLADETVRGGRLRAQFREAPDEVALVFSRLDLGGLCQLTWHGALPVHLGQWTGSARLTRQGPRLASEGSLAAGEVRVAALGDGGGLGPPQSVEAAWGLTWDGPAGVLDVRRWHLGLAGIAAAGRLRFEGSDWRGRADASISGSAELGKLLAALGLTLPSPLDRMPADDLGTATLEGTFAGSLAEPATLTSSPRLGFRAPSAAPAALAFLRGPFQHTALQEGRSFPVEVREGAPDFVALADVPPLFVRALLLSEDAGFRGHPGIDVAEIPIAYATNLARGTSARGASTITQQLVKNLFLNRQKTYGRKLQEATLALLVDACVPKDRLLEIYLNIIEWGPGVFGLRSAARHYFGKAPRDLTLRESAFLICVIPGPGPYHRAQVAGRLGAGFEQIVDNLLVKLRSVDAIDDAALEAARSETLAFLPEPEVASGDLSASTDGSPGSAGPAPEKLP